MPRTFKTVDYEATLEQKVSIRECLPPEHLARSIAKVITQLDISIDGTKIHADASKSKAVSYGYLMKLRAALEVEVAELLQLAEAADTPPPEGVDVATELERRQQKLANLSEAEAVLQARAQERYKQELSEYEAKLAERATRQAQTGRKPRGAAPKPPLWPSVTKTSTTSPTPSRAL